MNSSLLITGPTPLADDELVRLNKMLDAALENDPRLTSENTKRGYRTDLRAFEMWRAKRPFTKLLVDSYLASLHNSGLAPRSINRALAAIRWYAHKLLDMAREANLQQSEAVNAAMMEELERIAAIKSVRQDDFQTGRHLDLSEIKALLAACDADPNPLNGVRDRSIITLAYTTGLRRSEIAGLQRSNIVRYSLDPVLIEIAVVGKGNKQRTVYATNEAHEALRAWLKLRGEARGPLYCAIHPRSGQFYVKEGTRIWHGLTDDALALMLERRRTQANIAPLTWHDFRRTFAGTLLNQGNDIVTVQALMGHASPTTTARYDRRKEAPKINAAMGLRLTDE